MVGMKYRYYPKSWKSTVRDYVPVQFLTIPVAWLWGLKTFRPDNTYFLLLMIWVELNSKRSFQAIYDLCRSFTACVQNVGVIPTFRRDVATTYISLRYGAT